MRKTFTNIDYFKQLNDGLNIPDELNVVKKFREWKQDACTAYISTKNHRSNYAAASKFIKSFIDTDKKLNYVCIVTESTKYYKPDIIELYYKEI